MRSVAIKPLAVVPELLPLLEGWFVSEWTDYYGPGRRGNAQQDLRAYCNIGSLPFGMVAFSQGLPCGFAALKSEPFPSHPHLFPWAGAAYVQPSLRRQGIGAALLRALEAQGAQLGHTHLYCATSATLLLRCGWRLLEVVPHEATQVGIYERAL